MEGFFFSYACPYLLSFVLSVILQSEFIIYELEVLYNKFVSGAEFCVEFYAVFSYNRYRVFVQQVCASAVLTVRKVEGVLRRHEKVCEVHMGNLVITTVCSHVCCYDIKGG